MLYLSAELPFAIFSKKSPKKIDKGCVIKVCIDDFAFKKGQNYGTVMIDIDTRRIVTILQSRETDDVARWLREYPNIELVVRDGSMSYAAAITQAHPNAIQVNDRFHILKNLIDYGKKLIKKVVPPSFLIQIEADSQGMDRDSEEKEEKREESLSEMKHLTSPEKKQARVEQVRSLAMKGFSLSDIEKEVGLSHATVKKYLDAKFVLENKLEPYTTKIDAMLQDRCKFKEIETAIRKDGYMGARSTIQIYTTQQRKIMKEANAEAMKNKEVIKRKDLIRLLYLPIAKVKDITSELVGRIVQEYPVIGELYELVRSFKKMMFTKQANDLVPWIENALQLQIEEVNSFINGISNDFEAVKNAIALEYNNGLAEGSVNKLKVIKRIMYGRNNFILLQNKILFKEYGWGDFN
jgi:transposase